MPSIATLVNFGAAKTGLSTVGYLIANPDGTTKAARTTSGITELGTTGIYLATVSYDPNFAGYILWDTGEATPRYAAESINPVDSTSMADEVRTMLRSLNTSLSTHLERLLSKKPKKDGKDFKKIEGLISELSDAIAVLERQIDGIDVSPEIKIDLSKIENMLSQMSAEGKAQKEQLSETIKSVQMLINIKTKVLVTEFKKNLGISSSEIKKNGSMAEERMTQKMKFFKDALDKAVDAMLKDISGSVEGLIKRIGEKSKAEQLLESLVGTIREAGGRIPTNGKKTQMDSELRNLMLGIYR